MAAAAFIGVVWQMKMANLALAAMAPVGAVFTGAGDRFRVG
jgi:heme exporter protein C